tara:strand:+ start:294 stop:794 length:501 start_codon:yes stop_codon:yes gene_type:complete
MSRGFVKEDDQEEAPIIPPRAALPEGVINYVTPEGKKMLEDEKSKLEQEISNLSETDERERRRALAVLDGNLNLLKERLASARILDPKEQPEDTVRFGASVNYTIQGNSRLLNFKIVGVDEADVQKQKIAFIAPIARAVTGKKVGDEVDFQLGNENRKIEIRGIKY